MPRILMPFFIGFLLLGLFTLFSYIVDKELLRQFDFDTTVRLQDIMGRRFDGFFSVFSIIGNFEVLFVFLLAVLVFLRKLIAGLITFVAFGLFHVIEIFGKTVVDQLPPPQFMLRTDKLFDLPQFHVRLEYSYPSGHSGRTVFVAVLLLYFIWKSRLPVWLKLSLSSLVLGFTTIMCISRVYLGEHWTTDVVGGALLGAVFSLLCLSFYQIRSKKKFL